MRSLGFTYKIYFVIWILDRNTLPYYEVFPSDPRKKKIILSFPSFQILLSICDFCTRESADILSFGEFDTSAIKRIFCISSVHPYGEVKTDYYFLFEPLQSPSTFNMSVAILEWLLNRKSVCTSISEGLVRVLRSKEVDHKIKLGWCVVVHYLLQQRLQSKQSARKNSSVFYYFSFK